MSPRPGSAWGRTSKALVGVAVSAALVVYLFWNVDLHEVWGLLARTRWGFLVASVAINFLSLWLRSWRWYYLFPPGSQPSHLFGALMIGYMGNNLLPLRAGEIVRVYVASRRGQRFWTTLATLVVERILDGLAVGLIVVGLFFTIEIPRELRGVAFAFLGIDVLGMAVLALVAFAPGAAAALIRGVFHRWPWLEARLMDALGVMREGLRGVRAGHHVAPIAVSSVAIWVALAISVWTALRAANLDLPMAASWTALAFLGLGVSLPSSPGFIGVIQAATVLALALFGVPRAEALSFSLLFHASQFFPVTLCGLAFLFVEHVSLSEATHAAPAVAPDP